MKRDENRKVIESIEKGVKTLFREDDEGVEEGESIEVKGLGWLIYTIEDTAGSITVEVTKEKVKEPPIVKGRYTTIKVGYQGSFGRVGEGGYLYSNLKDNTYRLRETFDNDKELIELLINRLKQIK